MNNTTLTPDATDMYQEASEPHLALRVSMGIIAVVAFCSNGLLVLVFLRNRALLRTPYNVLIFSLAITDMATGKPMLPSKGPDVLIKDYSILQCGPKY